MSVEFGGVHGPVGARHKEELMKKLLWILVFALFATTVAAYAGQEPAAGEKKSAEMKPAHWSGAIVRTDKDASTLTVRRKGGMEKIVSADASTKWSKKGGGTFALGDLKEGDRVVCNGRYEGNKFIAAEVILQTPK